MIFFFFFHLQWIVNDRIVHDLCASQSPAPWAKPVSVPMEQGGVRWGQEQESDLKHHSKNFSLGFEEREHNEKQKY